MLKFFSLFLLCVSLLNAATTMKFDLIKKGTDDNNTLLLVGGIQGDEPGGFISASLIATHYKITKGSVWVVPNLNFESIILRNRGPYGDMNRKFEKLSKKDPEYHIVERIKSYILDDRVKLIVNLHDGSGFYRHKYIDKSHSPYKWGQSSIIDQTDIKVKHYGNLKEISSQVIKHVNSHLLKKEDKYHQHNTRTAEGDKEMERTLTFYAINQHKAAFGNEATKNLPTHKRVYYHLLAIEKYMQIMGIEYTKDFDLTPKGVYKAINNDLYISFYDGKIVLPLSQVRHTLKYFPIKKGSKVEFKVSNPLIAVIKKGNTYIVQYGNRRLLRLKADYLEYSKGRDRVDLVVDGKLKTYNFGTIIDVKKNFLVKHDKAYRVNVIGYTNRKKIETGVKIKKVQFSKAHSVDKQGLIYRVEYYDKKKFAGMLLVRFQR